ncbi:16S rRNA (guanine(527)-N(7))-methyltransferase RsmG [Desulfocurvibacter africanus]|uniref:16S rRNA (guanine(527)-N(7))-methyltransferase RsmG n=1 Tax=Desulfocurvibacter africanus TaxID=873 RepID=UPI00047F0FEB|nr:16S rRNA (guanine(527)-N(7))-methyltransferase RsmG [Desulfocurvibacter africanus]
MQRSHHQAGNPPQSASHSEPDSRQLTEAAAALGRSLDADQAGKLALYLGLLVEWNKRMNLVGASSWREVLSRLVMDSWHLADHLAELPLPAEPRSLDLGAGAGLPGIPLRIFWNSGEYRLVEIREKRTIFLRVAVAKLDLPRTFVLRSRVENLGADALPADLVLGRAFKPWPEYLELVRPMLAPGGFVVVFANEAPPEGAGKDQGFRLDRVTPYTTGGGQRYFWTFTPDSASR